MEPYSTAKMKRSFDFLTSFFLLIIFALPILLLAMVIKIEDCGPIFHWSKRVGVRGELFNMPKLRSMRVSAPQVATDRLKDPDKYITRIGHFLRKSSLDELPQLYSILIGQMSLVGPRPALFNQLELIEKRRLSGVDILRPGLTGWAQVNGRDDISDAQKLDLDIQYLKRQSLSFDLQILGLTLLTVLRSKGVSH